MIIAILPYCHVTIAISQSPQHLHCIAILPNHHHHTTISYCHILCFHITIIILLYRYITPSRTIDRHHHNTLLPYHHRHIAIWPSHIAISLSPYCHVTCIIWAYHNNHITIIVLHIAISSPSPSPYRNHHVAISHISMSPYCHITTYCHHDIAMLSYDNHNIAIRWPYFHITITVSRNRHYHITISPSPHSMMTNL